MRHFLEGDEDVAVLDAFGTQMRMRIEFCRDHGVRTDECTNAFEQIAFAIIVSVRHHCTMQAKDHDVDRQRVAELTKDFVPESS